MSPEPSLAVLVLTGGRSRRLGRDKASTSVADSHLLDLTVDGLPHQAAVVCIGEAIPTRRAVQWTREDPPYAGPLAAVEAGLRLVAATIPDVVLIGGDMPRAGLAIPALLAALGDPGPGLAVIEDASSRRQPLLSAWRRPLLAARLEDLAPTGGRALAAVLDGTEPAVLPDAWRAADDIDTEKDLARLRNELSNPAAAPPEA